MSRNLKRAMQQAIIPAILMGVVAFALVMNASQAQIDTLPVDATKIAAEHEATISAYSTQIADLQATVDAQATTIAQLTSPATPVAATPVTSGPSVSSDAPISDEFQVTEGSYYADVTCTGSGDVLLAIKSAPGEAEDMTIPLTMNDTAPFTKRVIADIYHSGTVVLYLMYVSPDEQINCSVVLSQ